MGEIENPAVGGKNEKDVWVGFMRRSVLLFSELKSGSESGSESESMGCFGWCELLMDMVVVIRRLWMCGFFGRWGQRPSRFHAQHRRVIPPSAGRPTI